MHSTLHDEYQDGTTAGSLNSARSHWLDLRTSRALLEPQRFSFAFVCPSSVMALGLAGALGGEPYAGIVTSSDEAGTPTDTWHVAGTTTPKLFSLSCLEGLFMGLRQAARPFESRLITLDLLPHGVTLAPGA